MINKTERNYSLDAIKFFSMIIVYLCHLKMSFFPDKNMSFQLLNLSIPNFLFNGNFAVCMFLLISVSLYANKINNELRGADLVYIAVKRYFRLLVPALFVNLIILCMYYLKLFYNLENSVNSSYASSWFVLGSGIRPIIVFLYSSIQLCFFENGYNPPLWCYNLLFLLPIIELSICYLVKDVDKRKVILVSFFLSLLCLVKNSYFSIIFIVLLITSLPTTIFVKRMRKLLSVISIIFVIILYTLKETYCIKYFDQFLISINIIFAMAVLEVFQLNENNFLNIKFFSKMNIISFGIYLLHMPVICSIGFYLFNRMYNILFVIVIVSVVLLFLSILFHIFVEKKLTSLFIKKLTR